jgi:hypothetical protein
MLSLMFAPGGRVLSFFIDLPVLQSIPVYKVHTLTAFANYWVSAVLIYLVLRAARVELWLKPRPAIHAVFGIGNGLLILYLIPRIFASSIQGGGPSYVVAMFSPFFVLPAQLLFLIGFIWLATRSISKREEKRERKPFGIAEGVALAVILAVPAAYASTLYFGEDAPFRIAREANQVFQVKCQQAGERIARKPTEPVKGLYLERDGSERYEQIKDGVYHASGSGILGEPLVNSGLLLFMEKNNDRPRPEDGGQFKYRRHGFKDWKGEPVDDITSEYGLYRKDLTGDLEQKLGIRGAEISIKDLKSAEIVATTTYFVSTRQRKFCGEAPNGYFDVGQFVMRALGLTKIYPSAWDKPAPPQK